MAWLMSKVDECEPDPEIAGPEELGEAAPSLALDTVADVEVEGKISDTLSDIKTLYSLNESVASHDLLKL